MLNRIHVFTIEKVLKYRLTAANRGILPFRSVFAIFLEGFPTTYRKLEKTFLGKPLKSLFLKFQTSSFKTVVVRDGVKMTFLAIFWPFFAVFRPKKALEISKFEKFEKPIFRHSGTEFQARSCGRYAPDKHSPYTHTPYIQTYRQISETG